MVLLFCVLKSLHSWLKILSKRSVEKWLLFDSCVVCTGDHIGRNRAYVVIFGDRLLVWQRYQKCPVFGDGHHYRPDKIVRPAWNGRAFGGRFRVFVRDSLLASPRWRGRNPPRGFIDPDIWIDRGSFGVR